MPGHSIARAGAGEGKSKAGFLKMSVCMVGRGRESEVRLILIFLWSKYLPMF